MIRALTIAAGGVMLAVIALLITFAQAGAALNPALAARGGLASGPAQDGLAALVVKTGSIDAGKAVLPADALALAESAYRREPLASHAAAILARKIALANPRAGLAVQEAVNRNSRRNTELSVDLLTAYGRMAKNADGLGVLDVLLRRQTGLQRDLIVAMSLEVRRPELLGDFRRLLARKPPWSNQFWRQLAQTPEGLANAAELRTAFARDGGRVDPEVDALLIGGLAQAGYYAQAENLAAAQFPAAAARTSDLVRNANFASRPVIPPLDWEVRNSSDFGATVDSRRDVLALSAIPGAGGEVARQLVHLVPGRSTLAIALAGPPQTGDARLLSLSLDCAGPTGEIGRSLLTTTFAGPLRQELTAPCAWAWLRLIAAVPAEGEGLDLEVRRVSIVPVGRTKI